MEAAALIAFTTAMLAVLNPIGNIALFMGLTSNYASTERRSLAIRSAFAVAVILVVTIWAGEWILKFFGVALPALQAAGGVIITLIALSMLHSSQSPIHDAKGDDRAADDIAIVPLAMPIVSGPGAIVTIIINTHKYPGVISNLSMSLICIVLAVLIAVCFLSAKPLNRLMGAKGLDVLTKFMGLILLAIAFGMFAEGAKGLFPGLAG